MSNESPAATTLRRIEKLATEGSIRPEAALEEIESLAVGFRLATKEATPSPQEEWERAYDHAMQWRDWQTCEILIDERATSDWYVPEEESMDIGHKTVAETVAAYPEAARDRRTGARLPCIIVRSKNTQWPWRCTVCDSLYSTPEGFAETTPTGDLRCPRARLS